MLANGNSFKVSNGQSMLMATIGTNTEDKTYKWFRPFPNEQL